MTEGGKRNSSPERKMAARMPTRQNEQTIFAQIEADAYPVYFHLGISTPLHLGNFLI
jgi:hypothetical protein